MSRIRQRNIWTKIDYRSDYMGYRILLKSKVEEKLLREIQAKHSKDIEEISELYESLILHRTCDSDVPSRIYYLAYTLALENIEIVIVRLN